jgi:hypothetical protein
MSVEQLQCRLPATVTGIEGQCIHLAIPSQNVSSKALDFSLKITGGLDNATITPARAHLAPGEDITSIITGTPFGDRIALDVEGPFGVRHPSIALRMVPSSEIIGSIPQGNILRFALNMTAGSMPHITGKSADDPSATTGHVWTATKGESQYGHLIYGPYRDFKAGRYLAIFRIKRTGEGEGLATILDACVATIQKSTATRQVMAEELPIGIFKSIPVLFDHPGGPLETRAFWPGNVSIAIDSVTIWEVLKH